MVNSKEFSVLRSRWSYSMYNSSEDSNQGGDRKLHVGWMWGSGNNCENFRLTIYGSDRMGAVSYWNMCDYLLGHWGWKLHVVCDIEPMALDELRLFHGGYLPEVCTWHSFSSPGQFQEAAYLHVPLGGYFSFAMLYWKLSDYGLRTIHIWNRNENIKIWCIPQIITLGHL